MLGSYDSTIALRSNGNQALALSIYYLLGDLGHALFIRSCHKDVIFTRKSHNCTGTAFVQGDSVGLGRTLSKIVFHLS